MVILREDCIRFRRVHSVNVPSNLWHWCGASGTFSPILAMRALAAILIVVVSFRCTHASQPSSTRGITAPLQNYLDCTWSLGVTKCLNALSVWRAERAINDPGAKQKLIDDFKQFPWNQYRNTTESELNSKLCEETEKLLRRQSLSLTMVPGFRFELRSKGNGTLNIDVYKNTNARAGRSSVKKAKKAFYKILPFLAVPGLLIAAVLPFFLPALKFMTLGAVMLNNMALSGAVFTLLRNNAFNDRYEHKIIYVNEGYKNEKHAKFSHQNHDIVESEVYYPEHQEGEYVEDEINPIESIPLNPEWNDPHYSFNKFTKRKSKSSVMNND